MSSTSAMSSGGPSSPNISDSLNSRSDFSISLASNDGGQLASEFSQMFQMLDNELGPESTQFAFDQFRQNSEEKTVVGKGSVVARDREKAKIDSFEGLDDEEDEPTISNDNYNVHLVSPSKKPDSLSDQKDLENINPSDLQGKREGISRIQKQISLYERDESREQRQLTRDVDNFTRRPGSAQMAKRWVDSGPQHTNYVSADNVSSTSFYIGRSPIKNSKTDSADPKTMSCMNLKSCAGPSVSPGAVVVKEKFIETPAPLRVAKSFHGNTAFLKYKCKKSKKMDAGISTRSSGDITRPASSGDIKHRFVTTKVNEFDFAGGNNTEAEAKK